MGQILCQRSVRLSNSAGLSRNIFWTESLHNQLVDVWAHVANHIEIRVQLTPDALHDNQGFRQHHVVCRKVNMVMRQNLDEVVKQLADFDFL